MARTGIALAAATITTLMLLAAPALSATTIRIMCADGGGDLFEWNGHTILSAGFCDADHDCDGICTFAFNPDCPVCLADQLSRRRVCSPDAYVEVCPGLPALPCPSGLPHVVLPLGRGRKGLAHKRIQFKFGKRHVTLLLRCEPGRACVAPPQAPPPGVPDVGGDWSLQETTANTDCASSVIDALRPPIGVRLAQDGVGLTACIEPQGGATGDVPPFGQGAVSGSTLSLSATGFSDYEGLHTFAMSLVAPLPVSGTSTTASEQWSIRQADAARTLVCTRTATATMSRSPMPPCTSDEQCMAMDACMRCKGFRCALSPLCQ
jgi:hypothetical protein